MKKVLGVLFILVILGGVIALAGYRVYKSNHREKSETTTEIQARTGMPVEVVVIGRGGIESKLNIYGTLKGQNEVSITPKIGGRIEKIYVDNGDRVRAGQVLVQIETKEINDQVNQARAALRLAKAALAGAKQQETMVNNGARDQERRQVENAVDQAQQGFDVAQSSLNRTKALYEKGVVAQQQYDSVKLQYDIAKSQLDSAKQQLDLVNKGARDEEKEMAKEGVRQAEAGVSQAEAAVAYAESQLKNATVTAPVSGVVASRMFDVGTLVGPSMPYPLMTIVDDAAFSIKSDISEVDLDKVRVGQSVDLTVDAIPGQTFTGTITEINPSATMGTRTFTLKVDVDNRDRLMKSGMFARGTVKVAEKSNVLKVPKDSIVKQNGKQGVFIAKCDPEGKECKSAFSQIETGIINTLTVEVLNGVQEGDEVVLVGAAGLKEGDKISVEKKSKIE